MLLYSCIDVLLNAFHGFSQHDIVRSVWAEVSWHPVLQVTFNLQEKDEKQEQKLVFYLGPLVNLGH